MTAMSTPSGENEKLAEELKEAQDELATLRAREAARDWRHIAQFEWDFTTGVVDEEVYFDSPTGPRGMVEAAGLTLPTTIDELSATLADKIIEPAWSYWYKTNLSTEYVQQMYEENGPFELAFERKLKSGEDGALYARYCAPIIENPATGHLTGRFIVNDCTNRYTMLAPSEYEDMDTARAALLEALKKVFQIAYFIDIENDQLEEFVSTDNIHGMVLAQHSISARETIARCTKLIAEDDRLAFSEFLDLDTISERLQNSPAIAAEFKTHANLCYAFSIIPVRQTEGKPTEAVVVTAQDVTADRLLNQKLQKAQVAAQAASEAKTDFLFNMSHDIRTPMNAIIGFSEIMERHMDDPARMRECLSKIQGASAVLLSIINNVLDMARIESGKMELEETPWTAGQLTDALYSLFSGMMREKGIELTYESHVEHQYVFCDTTKLSQIFNNILSNAYKYTERGGKVHICLKEIPCEREGFATYKTTISDTGVGMSEDFLPTLFDEFSREQSSTNSGIEGTGLGMPIVKRLVDLIGGTIEVESRKGVGTTFAVTFTHRLARKEDLATSESAEVPVESFYGKRILLAEDNELNAEIAMEILQEFGFEVEHAENGAVCLEMLAEHEGGHYDVVLMDIQMPVMNGYEAARAIRALDDPVKATIPVFAMTANAFEEDKIAARRAGMDGHIAKPIEIPKLVEALALAMGGY